MKKNLTFTILDFSLLLFSCSKKNSDLPAPPPPAVTKKIMTTTLFSNGASFEYSPDGSLKKIVDQRNWGTYRWEFSYQPGKVMVTLYDDASNKKLEYDEFTLNVKGFAEKKEGNQFDNSEVPYDFKTTYYYYNAQGQLEKQESPASYKYLYYYANGNLIKSEYYNGANVLEDYITYEYSNLADRHPEMGAVSWSWINRFLPSKCNKLASKMKSFDVILNKVAWENEYTYELDTDGFVLKGTYKDISQPGNPSYFWVNTWDK